MKDRLANGIIYHCGPIINKENSEIKIISAGPTTSERLSMYAPEIIKKYRIKAIIGKGGMDENTLRAMKEFGCVYLAATGGAGALIATKIIKIKNIYKEEFGMPEAIYELEVEKVPLVVAMDSKGNSIYENIFNDSQKKYKKLVLT